MTDETWNTVDGQTRADSVVQAGSIAELHVHAGSQAVPGAGYPGGGQPPYQQPYLLPPDIAHFENRHAERAAVLSALTAAGVRPDSAPESGRTGVRPLIVALTGIGGVGKSALGVRIAHETKHRFTDGVLYVDLDDMRRGGSLDTADVLAELLRPLGVRGPWLEGSLAGRRNQYWERTAGKRCVVVLDNVRYAAEAEPLIPSSADSVVLALSGHRLPELPEDLALPLGPLGDEHAVALLNGIAGDSPLSADPAAADELVRLCGGLPAVLRVAGEWVRKHRRWRPERLIAELRTVLDEEGIPVVEAVWDAAYRALSEDAALLYRLLAGHPGPHITPGGATALLGRGVDATDDALDELEDAGLLEQYVREEAGARPADDGQLLRMPGLQKAHAVRCRRRLPDEGAAETREGLHRLVRWFRRQAQRADRTGYGSRMRFAEPVPALTYAPDVVFTGEGAAAHWLEAERHALHGCVEMAFEAGDDTDAWSLCESLWPQYVDHGHGVEAIESFGRGLRAAECAEYLPAQVRMGCQQARALWTWGEWARAGEVLAPALRIAAQLDGERKLYASTLEFSGKHSAAGGNWSEAVERFQDSLKIHREIGNDYGVLLMTHLLGWAHASAGRYGSAAELLESAHAMAWQQDRERMIGRTAYELGVVLQRMGSTDRAAGLYARSLESALRRRSDYDEIRTREAITELARDTGDEETAAEHAAVVREFKQARGSTG